MTYSDPTLQQFASNNKANKTPLDNAQRILDGLSNIEKARIDIIATPDRTVLFQTSQNDVMYTTETLDDGSVELTSIKPTGANGTTFQSGKTVRDAIRFLKEAIDRK